MTITESIAIIRANLPAQLRDELELNEIKQVDLERQVEVFKDACGRYLRGEYIPSLPVALALSRTLGVTLDRLCTGED